MGLVLCLLSQSPSPCTAFRACSGLPILEQATSILPDGGPVAVLHTPRTTPLKWLSCWGQGPWGIFQTLSAGLPLPTSWHPLTECRGKEPVTKGPRGRDTISAKCPNGRIHTDISGHLGLWTGMSWGGRPWAQCVFLA